MDYKLKKQIFSQNEYNSIRAEMISRIENINNQANTAVITILSDWTVAFAFIIVLVQYEIKSCVFYSMGAFVFLIPILYFIPLALKSGENIRQIASISAYIRVFYDYCSLKNDMEVFNWESSNNICSTINMYRGKTSFVFRFYNHEYTVLSVASLLNYIGLSGFIFKNIIIECNNLTITVYLLTVILLITLSVCAVVLIHSVSCLYNAMMKNGDLYINIYINRAIELGFISTGEKETAQIALNPARYDGQHPKKKTKERIKKAKRDEKKRTRKMLK